MNDYRLVDTAASLHEAILSLKATLDDEGTRKLYLDTEFESNRSGTKLCLLQVSAGKTNFLFDPQGLRSLSPLGEIFQLEDVEWVLHAGLQDVGLITSELRIAPPKKLFDTQIAWALLTAESSVGLAYLQYKLLGIRSEKGHQSDDWVRRPLQESQLRYAASDVDYLPKMTSLLLEKAEDTARVEIIYAASRDALAPLREPPAPLSLSSFRNAWQLSARSQAGMLFLIDWFNALPLDERRDAPENKALLAIAGRLPENVGALGRIKGVPRSTQNRYGTQLVEGLHAAVQRAKTSDFQPLDPPPYSTFEEIRLDAWLAQFRSELAIELRFAPEFVLPGRLLKRMKAGAQTHGESGLLESLVGWRKELLLQKTLAFCKKYPLELSKRTS